MASIDAIAKRYQVPIVCGLLAVIAYLQGSGIASLIAEHLPADPGPPPPSAASRTSLSLGTKSGSEVLSRNAFDSVTGPLTGRPPPKPSATVAPPPDSRGELPACSSGNVVLITESNDPDFSFAVISTGSESKMRKVGDDVDGRKVEAIHAEHVVMAQGGARCQLKMHENSPVSATGKPSAMREPTGEEKPSTSAKELKSPIGQGIRKVSETEYVIEQNSADKLAQMERAFRSSGRTVDGSGLRLHRASQTTVLGQLGLMKGDIVKTINGHDMTSLDSSMTAYTQMKAAKNVQIVIERDGKPITMDYAVK